MKLPIRTTLFFILTSMLIIIPFIIWGADIEAWTTALIKEGGTNPTRTGLILASLLASDIIMPIPSCIASTACGLTLGFAHGTLASFVGMSISSLAGYLIGRFATPLATRMLGSDEALRFETFHHRYGAWLVLAMRPVPVLAEASMLFAGITRLPAGRVITMATLGNLLVSALYAAVGSFGRLKESTLTAFTLSILLAFVMMLAGGKKE